MTIERVGYGAGDRELTETPNVVRVLVGEAMTSRRRPQPSPSRERRMRVVVLECEIDDMNPQIFGVADGPAVCRRRARGVLLAGADEEEPARHADDDRREAGAARRA